MKLCKIAFWLVPLLFSSGAGHAQNHDHRLVTFEDLISPNLREVDEQMDISPDGKTLAYNVFDADSETAENLWLLNIGTKKVRQVGRGMMPRWSPDGTRLAFYSSESGQLQLCILDVRSEKRVKITDLEVGIDPNLAVYFGGWIGDALRYSWSPDGTRIAFTSQVKVPERQASSTLPVASSPPNENCGPFLARDQCPLVLTSTTPAPLTLSRLFRSAATIGSRYINGKVESEGGADSNAARPSSLSNQIFVVDVSRQRSIQVTRDDKGYFNPDWSPDGRTLVVASTEGSSLYGSGPSTTNLYLVDVATNQTSALTVGTGVKRLPSWSPDGHWIGYLGKRRYGLSAVFLVSRTSGEPPVNVTSSLDRDVSLFSWAPDGNFIFLSYQDGPSISIGRLAIKDLTMQRLTNLGKVCDPFAISRSGKLIWTQSDGSSLAVFVESDFDGRDVQQLVDLNPQLKEWILGTQELVASTNSRGEEVRGVLIKPVGFEEGKTYPLIVDPYPGAINRPKLDPMFGNQAFSSRGYAVFFPNARTAHTWENPFMGTAFNEAARGPKGVDIMMDDLMAGVDTLIRRGIVDPSRMCLYGFSNGGGATNQIITRTSRFACAVSASGVLIDWPLSFYLGGEDANTPTLLGELAPWDDPGAYVALSPIYHLNRVTTPLLLAVGDDERGVLVLYNIEMYNGLRYLGKNVTLLRYPHQVHGFTGDALKDYWQRANSFLDVYLRPEPATVK